MTKQIISEETAEFLYLEIIESAIEKSGVTLRSRFFKLYSVLRDSIKQILKKEIQNFPSLYAQLIFTADKYELPKDIVQILQKFRSIIQRMRRNKNFSLNTEDLLIAAYNIARLIEYFSQKEIPENIEKYGSEYSNESIYLLEFSNEEKRDFIRCVVKTVDKTLLFITAFCEEFGDFTIDCRRERKDLINLADPNATLHIFNFNYANKILIPQKETLICLEPDILFDSTELAECFTRGRAIEFKYFVSKALQKLPSDKMLAGTMLNDCFDKLIENPDKDFEETLNETLIARYMNSIFLLDRMPNLFKELSELNRAKFDTIRETIEKLNYDTISLEPTFISPLYGIQGRLDALLEYTDAPFRKTVLELKSGKAPSKDYFFEFDNKKTTIGVWENNMMQVTAYNMLLDTAYGKRSGDSFIFYPSDSAFPLRNVPNIDINKRELLDLRNKLVKLEKDLMFCRFYVLENIANDNANLYKGFSKDELVEFQMVYRSLSDLEKRYFNHYYAFILRENWASRAGYWTSKNEYGFSRLWRANEEDKHMSDSSLVNLSLIEEESDFSQFHISFYISDSIASKSFRKGDAIVLYKMPDFDQEVYRQQIIKGSIRELKTNKILVSFRNKNISQTYFNANDSYAIEPDFNSRNDYSLIASLFNFIKSKAELKKIILGQKKPEFYDNDIIKFENINQTQARMINQALRAKNYFLVQGPPGSGKTSVFLKNLSEKLYANPKETLLLLSYTNRATDEICSVLKNSKENIEFIRLGGKENSPHKENLLAFIAESEPLESLLSKLKNIRVIVSTVSSALNSPELFAIKKFTTCVIDEASQILEPQIVGLISKVDRFVMIGDEKQLPAVVLQDERYTKPKTMNLEDLGLNSLADSLFERLLRNAKKNGWEECYGLLNLQGRMHEAIQAFPNYMFYDNQLDVISNWQKDNFVCPNIKADGNDKLAKAIGESNLIFINIGVERHSKTNQAQAETVSKLVSIIANSMGDEFNDSSIGVIAPFRAQCTEIGARLPEEYKDRIAVDTVERFQGSERDIMIISLSINNKFMLESAQAITEIDGMQIDRKLNVSITRARKALIILGNEAILRNSDIYAKLIAFIKDNGQFIENC